MGIWWIFPEVRLRKPYEVESQALSTVLENVLTVTSGFPVIGPEGNFVENWESATAHKGLDVRYTKLVSSAKLFVSSTLMTYL